MTNISREIRRGAVSNVMPAITGNSTTLNTSNRTPESALNPDRVLTTINSTTTTTVNDKIIDRSIIPYMRQREVTYDATGLRPGITVSARFGGKDVTLSNSTVDGEGNISGTFTVPAGIPTGKTNFELFDAEGTTGAQSSYEAAGQLLTRQSTITSIRNITETRQFLPPPVPATPPPSAIAPQPSIIPRRVFRTTWRDPIAQSFLVETEGGAFITAIDAFFKTKDATIPVSMYVVTVENGVPSQNIIPFSQVTVPAASVNTSVDGSLATKFTFSDPLYLEEGEEYAFVLLTSSDKYEAYISTLGEADLQTGIGIARQPYLGTLFKSQNTSTWTADQLSDLKFRIYKANFTTSGGSFDLKSATNSNATYNANEISFHFADLKLPDTSTTWTYSHTNGGITNEALVPFEPQTIATNVNISDVSENNKLVATATYNTTNPNVSPVLDINRTSAFIKLNTLIDDFDNSLGVGEYNAGTYISQAVNLINMSDDVKVILEAKLPTGTRLNVYVKTNEYTPLYQLTGNNINTQSVIRHDVTQDSLIGKRVAVYTFIAGVVAKVGECIITGYDGNKVYFKSASDVSIFSLADGSTDLFVSDDLALNGATIGAWAGGTSYSIGDLVYDTISGKIWEAEVASTGSQPSSINSDWSEVVSVSIGGAADYAAEATVEWQPMDLEDTNLGSLTSGDNFIEYTYKPEQVISSDFDSFVIRVDLVAQNPATVPVIKSLRAIAVY